MELLPREKDKLLIYVAAQLASDRRARGLKLNYPEVVAIISAAILEGARDGRSVAEWMDYGATILSRAGVMEGIPEMIPEVQVEATVPGGTTPRPPSTRIRLPASSTRRALAPSRCSSLRTSAAVRRSISRATTWPWGDQSGKHSKATARARSRASCSSRQSSGRLAQVAS